MNVLTIVNYRRLAVCNCNCEHYRTKFYFGIWCQNKVIIIIIITHARCSRTYFFDRYYKIVVVQRSIH